MQHIAFIKKLNDNYFELMGGGIYEHIQGLMNNMDVIIDTEAYQGNNALNQCFKVARWCLDEVLEILKSFNYIIEDLTVYKNIAIGNRLLPNYQIEVINRTNEVFNNE